MGLFKALRNFSPAAGSAEAGNTSIGGTTRSGGLGRAGRESGIRMMSKAKGGKVSAAEAVHKHERAKHKGQPLTKMAKGGSASKRADGCATKGKTKGKFV